MNRASPIRRIPSPFAFVIVVAVAAAACGGAAATPSPSPRPTPVAVASPVETIAATVEPSAEPSQVAVDPCGLITKAEADALAGEKLQDATPAGTPPVRCVWPTPLSGSVAQVEIDVGDGAQKFMDIERMLDHPLDPVPGLADEAYQEDDTIFFRSGDTWVAIHLIGDTTTGAARKPMQHLAATVASRL